MTERDHIRNPIEWGVDQLKTTDLAVARASHSLRHHGEAPSSLPAVHRIGVADLRDVLAKGLDDFAAYRTDVVFICIIYPLAGLVLARLAAGYDMLPLVFPLASGFALLGPIAAVGLYEMSRRREQGADITWLDAFGVVKAPAFGAILVLGLVLLAIFLLWLAAAWAIYMATLGPAPPASVGSFVRDVFTTGAGWAMIVAGNAGGVAVAAMIVAGNAVGFLFAVLVLTISVVSFPLLLDRDEGLYTAVATSILAVVRNPVPMAAWGLIVVGGLVLGSLPALLGLVVVMPVLGHATWHLYRKLVPR